MLHCLIFFRDTNVKKRKRTTAWQLSTKNGAANDQYLLDAGQNKFGATQCPECGVIYHLGDPEDENSHLNYHNSIKTLKFQVGKLTNKITTFNYSILCNIELD